jgi:HEAT repeat protein
MVEQTETERHVQDLSDESWEKRIQAGEALARLDDPRGVPALIN